MKIVCARFSAAAAAAAATILHLLGIDHRKLSYRFQGLDYRLTGVEDQHPVKDIIA